MSAAEPLPAVSGPRIMLSRVGPAERAALAFLLLITLVTILAPVIAPHDPTAQDLAPYTPPGSEALLGTDDGGRDLLSRTLYGMRASWWSALAVIGFSVVVGGAVGLLAGIRGGRIDTVLMAITDAGLAMPGPVLAIAVTIALGPNLVHTLIAVALVWWPWYARIVRGEARALMVRPHVDAARVAGASRSRIARKHVLPGLLPALIVTASLDLGVLILTLASLAFLGLGATPPTPELGAMVQQGLDSLFTYPWVALVPAIAVFALAAAANLAGDGLRDLLEHA